MSRPLETIAYLSDYRFLLCDAATTEWQGEYTNSPGEEGIGLASGIVAILGPRTQGPVAVFLEMHSSRPADPAPRFCKVLEAPIRIRSGTLRILGEGNTEGQPGLEFSVEPRQYIVRISYADLNTVETGASHGAEHYWLELYPDSESETSIPEYRVIRPYEYLEHAVTELLSPMDVEELHWLAQDPSPSVRCSCIVALARQKQFKAVLHLALNDSSRCVRMVAVGALAMMKARDYLEMVSDRETGLIGRTARNHLNNLT